MARGFGTRRDGRVYPKQTDNARRYQEALVNTNKIDIADMLGPEWMLEQETMFTLVYRQRITGKYRAFNKFTGKENLIMRDETLEDLLKGPRREDYR